MLDEDPFGPQQEALEELSEAVRTEEQDRELADAEGLDTLSECIETVADSVVSRDCSAVVVLDGSNLGPWERKYGSGAFNALMARIGRAFEELRGTTIRTEDVVCIDGRGGDSIVVFLGPPRKQHDGLMIDFEEIGQRLKAALLKPYEGFEIWYHEALDHIATGSALIIHNDSVDPRREIYRAIRQARADSQTNLKEVQRRRHRVLGHMIAQRRIRTFFQPIVDLETNELYGWEALSRASGNDAERLGVHLFVAANRADLDGELDQTCRALSLHRRPGLNKEQCLFVNTLPTALYGHMSELEGLLEQWMDDGLEPHQLVFEITENITHEQLRRILPSVDKLRDRGFRFAVDDVGTGQANLQLITDIEPQFLKMDISLTRGIAHSERKQALADYLLELSARFNAHLIAEGIEDQHDRETLEDLGVRLGQGFLLGRPQEARDQSIG